MTTINTSETQTGEVVLPCSNLETTLSFFTDVLGFSVVSIFPADAPRIAALAGFGLRLRLDCGQSEAAGMLRLYCNDVQAVAGGKSELIAPNGTRIELLQADSPLHLPALEPSLVITRMNGEKAWGAGRAGMKYRDLIPDRQGGRFIASHIRIESAGPVPDYVHFHRVSFQLIYCYKGWVRVVYEDQGPPFVMHAGDCVLQPPQIRHRVLESSAGLEVIEISCPAEHETMVDHELSLPTENWGQSKYSDPIPVDAARSFSGQRFVRHQADNAKWQPWRAGGFACRELGSEEGSGGAVSARVVRPVGDPAPTEWAHDGELLFDFVLTGKMSLQFGKKEPEDLAAADACTVPAGMAFMLTNCSQDLEFLEVTVPA